MRTGSALFLTASFVFLIVGNYYFFYPVEKDTRERVFISRAIDGDTVVLSDGRTIRLININTPEKKERGYGEARSFLEQFENTSALLDNRGQEKYGRTLGAMYVGDVYLNLEIVRKGLAHSFLVNEKELSLFRESQKEAVAEQLGIWKHSQSYGCLTAEIDKKDENVVFMSKCKPTLDNWTVKDETTHRYVLREPVQDEFTLFSDDGTETPSEKYWRRGNVWNDDRDTLFVRDEQELLVLYQPYGY